MPNTLWAVVRENKIELLEDADIPEGTKVLVVLLNEDGEPPLWNYTSQCALDTVWNNSEDDIYARLLEE